MKKIIRKLNKLPKKKRIQLFISAVLTIMLIIITPVVAWFAYDRHIESMIKVNAPTVITIGSGGEDVAEMINLANINVEETIGSGGRVLEGDYVFSVQGKYLSQYDLQIARTTNIPFEYEIYRVSSVDVDGDSLADKGWGTTSLTVMNGMKSGTYDGTNYYIADYLASNGTTYYYPYVRTEVSDSSSQNYQKYGYIRGEYLNPTNEYNSLAGKSLPIGDGEKPLGTGTFHTHNYDNYGKVNKYAEPLYWQAISVPINEDGRLDNGHFVDYYVLKIRWTANFSNNKETDMIYITARRH